MEEEVIERVQPVTIRSLMAEFQAEAKLDSFAPSTGADMVRKLTALLGNVNVELRRREMAYNRFRLDCYQSELKANRAKMISEASQQYEDWQEVKHLKEELIELIRSLKVFVRNAEEEYRRSGSA